MRLHIQLVYCLLAVVFFNANVAFADEAPLTTCQSLTASGNSEYPPFLWRDSPNSTELYGVNRLIIDELSRRINISIKLIHVGPWSRAQSEVKSGRVDLMAGAFYTNERADYMDYFTPVLLHTTSVVWQSKDKPFPYNDKEDLVGKWGVTVINNSFGQEFDQYAQRNLNILEVASLSQALRMLAADRVDYVLYEKSPAQAYATMLGLENSVVPVTPYISREGLYLTMSKKSPCNTDSVKLKIAVALQSMKQDGFTRQAALDSMQEWDVRARAGLKIY